ncbi:acyl-CoA dehydrogenase family protein, partial [Williamsia sp.]|uniref:acyl-CoA dehydrogenase family protein n=1 Tax=Williamsia sp. TaxID=1872085 RepID=UPI002F944E8E
MTAVADSAVTCPKLTNAQAVAVAHTLAAGFAETAARRDAERLLPGPELDQLTESGLLAITVPQEYGGSELPAATVAEVFRILASADPSIAQIPHSHFVYVKAMREQGTPAQQEFFFGEVLAGKRFGNAQSETGTKHVRDIRTTLTPESAVAEVPTERAPRPRRWLLNGTKGYATGALFADWIPVLTHLDVDGPLHVAWVERTTPGVTVIDDWNGMGQRTTASGTVELINVQVTDDRITPYHLTFDRPQTYGAFAQLLHSALDVGIARAAVDDAAEFVRTKSRPFPDAEVESAADDPLIVQALGQMEVAVRGTEALLREAGTAVDAANGDLTADTAGTASLAVAAS